MTTGSNSRPAPAPNAFARAVNAELRAMAGRRTWSQRRLAQEADIPQSTLGRMVWLETRPLTVHYLKVVCDALGVDPLSIVAAAKRTLREQASTQQDYRLAAKTEGQPDVSEEDYF
ncbi:helix-turn-helix transcriptional regulator [Kocuria indica]|uniref:helix-turn-helix domain-containing protein n=1 Tax=Kocuria marina TaxID=223184 RepID=UPI001EF48265|nr:helix-turn-helix transcriptional regulator [Kocuria indica]MCG7432455.1 helix-turn-helix transcriptional regulator [Kocuria indica]